MRYYSAKRFLIRVLANVLLPIYFRLTANNPKYKIKPFSGDKCDILVSLTSFPSRINRVWLTLETILRQTYKPDRIILWLSKEQFHNINRLPKKLLNLQNRGIEIKLRDGDLKSYKKCYYVLTECSFNNFITIDDDIFYRTNAIETLIIYAKKNPNCVITNYASNIIYQENNIKSYSNWECINKENTNDDLFFGTGGGTLFPIFSLYHDVINKDVFMDICHNADDVWMNAMVRINGTRIIRTNYSGILLPILNINNINLSTTNLNDGQNDIHIANIRKYCIEKWLIDPFAKI